MARVLVIGYGNVLRGDDALGLRVVEALKQSVDPAIVELMELQQLAPELAETFSHFELLILVDASMIGEPGTLHSRRVLPKPGPRAESHIVDPASLLNLAANLYHHAPRSFVVTVTGEDFSFTNEMSDPVSSAVGAAVVRVEEIIAKHFGSGSASTA